jgi:hypothetical protein
MKAVMQDRAKNIDTRAQGEYICARNCLSGEGESVKAAIQEVTRVRGLQNFEGEGHMKKTTWLYRSRVRFSILLPALLPLLALICAPFQEASAQYVDFDDACAGCLIGNPFSGFRNEFMLNINNDKGQADFIRKMISARTDRVVANGFDAVEYDVLANFENRSGFTITSATQTSFNISLTTIAHNHFLSVPLKSDVDQATDSSIKSAFDFVIDEQCNQFSQCGNYSAWQTAEKAIFNVEYKLSTGKFCPHDNSTNFNGIMKSTSLDVTPYKPCR